MLGIQHLDAVFSLLLLLGFVIGSYFAPVIVALARDHRQKLAIFILNLFLGWTILGWVGALVWSATSDVKGATR